MKNNKIQLILILVVLLLLVQTGKTPFCSGVQAQVSQASVSKLGAVLKWEYCAITDDVEIQDQVFGITGAAVIISYFELNGRRQERIDYRPTQPAQNRQPYKDYKDEALAKALAKLGEEGWEMVGVKVNGENGYSVNYLFKRPKQ